MALLEKTAAPAANKDFEMDEEETGNTAVQERPNTDGEAGTATAAGAAAAAGEKLSESTQIANVQTATSVARKQVNALVQSMTKNNPYGALEKAVTVDYNTLRRIQVNQGSVLDKDNNDAKLGESVVIDMISFQPSWMVTTGGDIDDKKAKEFLAWSDDGKVEKTTGRPLSEFVQAAIDAGYEKAKITERVILVGELVSAEKPTELIGELVQCDMAPGSRKNFESHKINTAFKVARGRLNFLVSTVVKITAKPMSEGNKKWTDAVFSVPDQAILDKVLSERPSVD